MYVEKMGKEKLKAFSLWVYPFFLDRVISIYFVSQQILKDSCFIECEFNSSVGKV